MRGRRLIALAVAAVTATAVGACTSPSKQTESGAQQEQQHAAQVMASAQDPDAAAPAPDVSGARKGGTLTVLSSNVPHTLDPTRAYYLDTISILKLVARGLTQTRYENGKPTLVPDLATDLGRPNADFTRWEFTLRDGLKYENGKPVKAADVAWAIKRQMARVELPDGPTYGLDYYLAGDTYQGPWASGEDFDAVETPDDKTIVVKMRKPFPSMPYYVSLPAFTPIPPKSDTKEKYGDHPLATGPYKFKSYQPGSQLTLEKNPYWDPKTDPNRHQYVDGWVFKFGLDDTTLQKQIIADNGVDQYSLTTNNILAENLPAIENDKAVKQRFMTGGNPCVSYMWMDTRKINPLAVRQAVAKAWPIAQSNKISGEIPGMTWNPSTSIMSSVVPGWLKFDVSGTGGKGNGDPAAAHKLLEDANQLGFELSFYYSENDPIEPKLAEVWRQALEKAGFQVKPIPAPKEQQRALRNDPNSPVNLRRTGWCADWANADSVIPAILDGRKATSPGAPNPSFLNVDEVNKEMDRILALPAKKALPEWGKLDKLIMEKYLPAVVLGEGGTTLLRGSKVGGMAVDSILSSADFTQLYAVK
ncbi:ABC transporter substrate-binding protein [Flindersiella endophytica]